MIGTKVGDLELEKGYGKAGTVCVGLWESADIRCRGCKSVKKLRIGKKIMKGSVSTETNVRTKSLNKCPPNIYLLFFSFSFAWPPSLGTSPILGSHRCDHLSLFRKLTPICIIYRLTV